MTSMPLPTNMTAVYFLKRRVHIPWARATIKNMENMAAKAPFMGIDGRYPQYDSMSGHVLTVQVALHAFRAAASPVKHRIWAPKEALELSMVTDGKGSLCCRLLGQTLARLKSTQTLDSNSRHLWREYT